MGTIHNLLTWVGALKMERLAQAVAEKVLCGQMSSPGILAITPSAREAEELREAVCARLLGQGRAELAQVLREARFTSVSMLFLALQEDLAPEIEGVRPEQVLDEGRSRDLLLHCLSDRITPEKSAELAVLRSRWPDLCSPSSIARVVQIARDNGLLSGCLPGCLARSRESYRCVLQPAEGPEPQYLERLAGMLQKFVAQVDPVADPTVETGACLARVRALLDQLSRGGIPPWKDLLEIAHLGLGTRSRPLFTELSGCLLEHDRHPRFAADGQRVLELVFELAEQGWACYEARKREGGWVDRVDLESRALQALRHPAVRKRLGARLELVVVDEFQDASPLQLSLYLSLSGIVRESIWAGDQRQSLSGCGSSDPAFLDALMDKLSRESRLNVLATTHRARAELFSLSRALFTPAFEPHEAGRERIVASASIQPLADDLDPPLEKWVLVSAARGPFSLDEQGRALGRGIQQLLEDPRTRVRAAEPGASRRLSPGDIAVLCRTPEHCHTLARALTEVGLVTRLLVEDPAVAAPEDSGAVAISTYLGAKGRGWPIVVLSDLEDERDTGALGVQAVTEAGRIQIDDPLAGRWIRFLPDPYLTREHRSRFHQRLSLGQADQEAHQRIQKEQLRLLYVAWTRASDKLVLPLASGGVFSDPVSFLGKEPCALLEALEQLGIAPGRKHLSVPGCELDVQVRVCQAV